MSQLELVGTFVLPTWAVIAMKNGDLTGVSDHGEELIDNWLASLDHDCLTFEWDSADTDFVSVNDMDDLGDFCATVVVHGHRKSA